MLDTMMKVSLTLVAFDKMSKVIKDAVRKSNDEFAKLQDEIKDTSEMLDKLGQNMTKLGAGLTAIGGGLAYKLGITEAIPEAFQMEHRLRELGNVGQLSAKQLEDMDKRLASISRYTNQMRPEIAEGSGRPVYLRAPEEPLPGIAPALRGVPHAAIHQQHPGYRAGRQRSTSIDGRRGRSDSAALFPEEQNLLRFRRDCPQNRRQGKIRMQGGSYRRTLPLQFCPHGHRVGMPRHGVAHGHLRG